MVDVNLFRKTIKDSGMTTTFICKKSGILRQTLYNRFERPGMFTIDEIVGLKKVLRLSADDVEKIFFAENDNL